jgi:hypothetical protein
MSLGKYLIVEAEDHDQVAADPIAAKYLRPFRQGEELVNGLNRWCLWLAADDFHPADVAKSPILKARVQANRQLRENAALGGDAYKYRNTPHLFRPNKSRPLTGYTAFPRVVSETRRYYTVAYLPAEVIAGDQVFTAEDPDGIQFALASSAMFITWQRTVGGRLKSDLRFSKTYTWHTFPVPDLDENTRRRIIKAGTGVLDARALHPERSLAIQYTPNAMDVTLVKAHYALDREVDKAFGTSKKPGSEKQRLELLFQSYLDLTGATDV